MGKNRKTDKIRLEKAKIARRQAYAEKKADPVQYDLVKEKEKVRYKKRKEKKQILKISEKSDREQRIQRKKWREAAKKYRQRKKQELSKEPMTPEVISVNKTFEFTKDELMEDPLLETQCNCSVKIKRLRMIELRKRIKMANTIKAQREEIERLKKKIYRHNKKVNEKSTKDNKSELKKKTNLKTIRKKNVVASENLSKLIEKFYSDDSNSVIVAGKKQYITKNKIQKQKRYITSSLKNLHLKFIKQSNKKISYSTFCHFRPFWVLIPKNIQRDTCMCTIHANIELIIQALYKEKIINEKNATDLLTSLCCSINENCLLRNCNDCKNKVIHYNEFTNEETITYLKWIRSKENITTKKGPKMITITKKEEFTITPLGLINILDKDLDSFMRHCCTIHIQYCTMKDLKERLAINEAIIHVDFSENYGLKCAQEVQSMHFGGSRKEICLHTAVYYTFDFQKSVVKPFSVCTVSECLRHDAPAIWAHLLPLIRQVLEQNPFIDTLHFQSDSPSSQYRNKYMFHVITKIHEDFHQITKITWNYTESGHGKGAPDGVGAVLKRTADAHVNYGSDVNNFSKFITLLQKNVENVTIIPITEENVKDKQKLIPNNLTTFRGTLGVHQVLWQKEVNSLTFRNASCFSCDVNIICAHGRHIGFQKIPASHIHSPKTNKGDVVPLASTSKNKNRMILKNISNQKIIGVPSSIKILSNKKIVKRPEKNTD